MAVTSSSRTVRPPHALTPSDLEARLRTDLERGLEGEEARARLQRDGLNELPRTKRPSFISRLGKEFTAPMSVLLIAAAVVAGVVVGELVDGVVILAIVVLNAVIGVVQEGKATNSLEALRSLETPTARVRRGGSLRVVPSSEVVVGDVAEVESGERIPADMRLVAAVGLEVDESLLTGESLPVEKSTGIVPDDTDADRPNIVHAGTFVAHGGGVGVVIATGAGTRMGAIAAALDTKAPPTPLQRELSVLTRRLGVAAVLVAGAVFALVVGPGGGSVEAAFLVAVALAVAAVPEGLPTVVTLGLALGVRRMAKKGAIVRRLSAVESLGAATVLLTDKTGTLTENRMGVDAWLTVGGTLMDLRSPAGLRFQGAARAATLASLDPPVGDPMDLALLAALAEAGSTNPGRQRRDAVRPFDSVRKSVAVVVTDEEGVLLATKGAPEELATRCGWYVDDGGESRALDPATAATVAGMVDRWAERGARLLAVADRRLVSVPTDLSEEEHDLVLVGMIAFRDPLRTTAAGAVADAQGAGIDVVMVTGDHPGTARAVADAAGIDGHGVITGRDLREQGLPPNLDVSVFARVEPAQKLELVEAYQARGDVVAVTGDGVNDGPALRRADIGVAMGMRGSDVAKEASALVIVDDDLSTIVAAVEEGRGIYDNLRKVVDYLVAGNLSEIFVVVAGLLVLGGTGSALSLVQLLWLNLLTDGLPALALGVDATASDVLERRPRRRSERLLGRSRLALLAGRAALIAAAPLAAYAAGRWLLDVDQSTALSMLFTTLVFAHVLYAFAVRPAHQRLTTKLVAAVAVAMGLQGVLVLVAPLGAVFDVVGLTVPQWIVVLVASFIPMGGLMLVRGGDVDRTER